MFSPKKNYDIDLTVAFQVEIIEETIRYIDALHHQLAARIQPEVPDQVVEQQQQQNCEFF